MRLVLEKQAILVNSLFLHQQFFNKIIEEREISVTELLAKIVSSSVSEMILKRRKNVLVTLASPKNMPLSLRLLLVLIVALNVVDVATTVYGLSIGGSELNPLFPGDSFISAQSLIIKIGLPFVYVILFTMAYILCVKKGFPKGLWVLNLNLLILIGFYIVIVVNNLLGIITKMTLH